MHIRTTPRPRDPLSLLLLLTSLLAASVLAVTAGPASAAVTSVNCAPFGNDDLQAVINSAAAGDTLLIKGTCSGNFTVSQDVKLEGTTPGATLDGGEANNTLAISGATVMIRNLRITGGGGLANFGGGIFISGSTVTLVNSTVSGNTASIAGGGILAYGGSTLSLRNSTVSGNTTVFNGGGISAFGSTVSVTGSIVTGNTVFNQNEDAGGGGIWVGASTATVTASTVSGNTVGTAPGFNSGGGGIDNESGGTLTVAASTVTGNNGGGVGGGITNGGGAVSVNNSTVDHNTSGAGGGIWNDSASQDATLTIRNSSLSFNHAISDDPLFGGGGGIFNFAESSNTANLLANGLTMIGNTASAGHGGAIANENLDGAAATATIGQSRIGPSNGMNPNKAIFGGGIYNDGTNAPASVSLQPGTIVAHNQASNDGGGVYNTGANAVLSISPGVVVLFNNPDNISDESPGGNS